MRGQVLVVMDKKSEETPVMLKMEVENAWKGIMSGHILSCLAEVLTKLLRKTNLTEEGFIATTRVRLVRAVVVPQ